MKQILLILVLVLVSSCGGRTPSAKTAANMTEGYFKTYAKKYKTSFIGQAGVERAQVNGIREISQNVAQVDAIVGLKNGQAARVLLITRQTPPLGWKITSWELLGAQ